MHESSEEELKQLRLRQFLQWMWPVAVGFLLVYAAFAVVLRSPALAGGSVAVGVYTAALVWARRLALHGHTARAAWVTGHALLVMVAIGSLFVHFLFAALLLMPVAGVALVLPYLERRELGRFMFAALGVDIWVTVVDGLLPPLVEQPPSWLQQCVLALAVVACVALTFRLLWVDSARLRRSLVLAEKAVAARDEFLSVASHELRTPLTPLSLRLQQLRRELSLPPPHSSAERAQFHLDVSQRQVKKLVDLVDDLLDVSRISAGRLELRPTRVDLAEVVRDAVRRFEPQARRAGCTLTLELDGALMARVDPLRFEQVLDNLLSNALKYGAGKPIRVRLERHEARARLTVRDEGIGIAPAALERIFDRFERAVSERHFGGLGLGLYIVRRVVAASGGTISAASVPGQGATFTVELPLSTDASLVPLVSGGR
ncbi:HAMP domain-containing histidine kinase [Pyxidicoccus parkwayensis]|uniref:histidine kinase n=1 Tax=Pyxidicoccus parkwayensis TaxID=2813578 RepID=A0ABX7NNW3_9BACT|nr:HAMP domain-containing sensor histidine kinase [Pyxidicoccus parkwaysis]QSQ20136.1 HAMP domain-containing histidine kinase [Pyxidicoccus parkwaysis]